MPSLADLQGQSRDLVQSLKMGRDNLFRHQHQDGYWWYTLEANDTINAEYIMLMHYLGIREEQTEKAICRWLEKNQNSDGSWSLFYDGPGDISTSVECYFALKLAGYDVNVPVMEKARKFILSQGGITKIRVFSRIHLALFGLVSWEICPKMPIAFIQLPEWAPVNIYEFSSWARACIVPLLVIMDHKRVVPSPVDLNELYVEENPQKAKWKYQQDSHFLSVENAFIQIDKALALAEKLNIKPLRKGSLKKCEKYIKEHLEETEDIYPALFYGILALISSGHTLNDRHVQKALQGLRSFHVIMSKEQDLIEIPFQDDAHALHIKGSLSAQNINKKEGSLVYQQCCISPVWDTLWAGVALIEAGAPPNHPELLKAARWILSKQITDVKGDWSVKNPAAEAGGWSFEFENKYYPDVDDTIAALTFLYLVDLPYREVNKPFEKGLQWLISMQSSNGGFGAFDVDNNLEVLNKIPFSDHGACLDPATVDLTGRALELFVQICDMDKNSPVIQRAADFIIKRQEKDGSWWGRWGVNYLYGTWGALGGLCALNRPKDRLAIQKAVHWLKSIQNEDGGFGESCESYNIGKYVALHQSTADQTAWALMGLISAGEAHSPEAKKAVEYLMQSQLESGGWSEKHFTGTGFPGHFYILYHGYKHYFPLMALGRYEKAMKKGQ